MSLTRGDQRCSVVSALNEYDCFNFINGIMTREQKLAEITVLQVLYLFVCCIVDH